MAHFARLDKNNRVIQGVVVDNKDTGGGDVSQEAIGAKMLSDAFGGTWKQTSYNANFRGNYAAIGDTYDADRDIFVRPKPHPSSVWNEEKSQWDNPPGYPDANKSYEWWEGKKKWVERAKDAGAPCELTEEEKAKL